MALRPRLAGRWYHLAYTFDDSGKRHAALPRWHLRHREAERPGDRRDGRRFGRRKSTPFGVYSRTLRTLRATCEPVGRAPTIGRPWLWRLLPGFGGCAT